MKKQTTTFLERYRIKTGPLASDSRYGFNGAFFITYKDNSTILKVVVSDGAGWEHVSVSLPGRCPTWDEMCWIKDLFWEEEEAVTQFHPPKSSYVNNAKHCLHLWKETGVVVSLPPTYMVGIKELGTIG